MRRSVKIGIAALASLGFVAGMSFFAAPSAFRDDPTAGSVAAGRLNAEFLYTNGGIGAQTAPKKSLFSFLSETGNKEGAIAALTDAIRNGDEECNLTDYDVKLDDFSPLFLDLVNHNPAFFYVTGVNYTYNTTTKTIISVKPEYTLDDEPAGKEEIDAATLYYQNNLGYILEQMPEGMTDPDKALWLHDYICTHFEYDNSLKSANAYSFFKTGKGVCQAYTMTYAALLSGCGIPWEIASSKSMNHIWNLVSIDGNWYHTDVTWDDAQSKSARDVPGRSLHENFLCSDELIQINDHKEYTALACTKKKYDAAAFRNIPTAGAFLDGSWYMVDRSNKMLVSFAFSDPKNADERLKLKGVWYQWGGDGAKYAGSYAAVALLDGKLYVSGPDTLSRFDPETDSLTKVYEYTGGVGYIYTVLAEDDHLNLVISTSSSAIPAEIVACVPAGEEPDPPPTDEPEEEDPDHPPMWLIAEGYDYGAFRFEKAENDYLMFIGKVDAILQSGGVSADFVYKKGEETVRSHTIPFAELTFWHSVSAGEQVYKTTDAFCIFGLCVQNIPLYAWDELTLTLTDELTGEILYTAWFAGETEPDPDATEDTGTPPDTVPPEEIEDGYLDLTE